MSSKQNLENRRDDIGFWDRKRGTIRTRKGGFVISKGTVYSHGYRLLEELMGKITYFQLLILNATSRLPKRPVADWLEASVFCVSYPDARIWCNHIGSLGGAMQATPIAANCAGLLATDSRLYGPLSVVNSAKFITEALTLKKAGMDVEEIVETLPRRRPDGTLMIPGFNRPVASGDERIPLLEELTKALGFEMGAHLTLAYEIEGVTSKKYNEYMNSGGYRAAFLSDQGYNPQEIYRIISIYMNVGITACYSEAADQPGESFFPLRCEDIDYQGKPPRKLPDDC
jgi:citrate synthase